MAAAGVGGNGSPTAPGDSIGSSRIGEVKRVTKETNVQVKINLDGTGVADCSTGIPFLDHMLDQLASHGLFDVYVKATGDTHIDDHHSNEDIALAIGTVIITFQEHFSLLPLDAFVWIIINLRHYLKHLVIENELTDLGILQHPSMRQRLRLYCLLGKTHTISLRHLSKHLLGPFDKQQNMTCAVKALSPAPKVFCQDHSIASLKERISFIAAHINERKPAE
ncbi:unnamed protein product [Miscanthus lutarioriparius]|uniref:imidazoleglycerol-phosphate dehydratase n=1 Tax=Miscanthus lutarioriparius TaxID=422564 RepID=A0A811QKS0_9POAL|nr:unnamed protein product [Miscanthus lutarioriparius]